MPGTIGNLLGAGLFLDGKDLILAGGAFYNSQGNPNVQPNKMIFSLDLNSKNLNTNSQSEWNPIQTRKKDLKPSSEAYTIEGLPLTLISKPGGWLVYGTSSASIQVENLASFLKRPNLGYFQSDSQFSLLKSEFDRNTRELVQSVVNINPVIGYSFCQRSSGDIYMSGGLNTQGLASNSFYRIDAHEKLPSGPSVIFHSSSCLDNEIVLLGGFDASKLRNFDKIDIYNYNSGWVVRDASGTVPSPRYLHATATLPSGHIVISGGLGLNNQALNDLYLLDTIKWTWVKHDIVLEPRFGHAIAVLKEHLIIAQGWSQIPFGSRLARRANSDPRLVVIATQGSPWHIVDSLDLALNNNNSPDRNSSDKPSPAKDSTDTKLVIGTAIGSILLFIAFVTLWLIWRRRNSQKSLYHKRLHNIHVEKPRRLTTSSDDTVQEHTPMDYTAYSASGAPRGIPQPQATKTNLLSSVTNSNTGMALRESVTDPNFARHASENRHRNTIDRSIPSPLVLAHRFHPNELVEDRDLYDTGIALPELSSPISSTHISSMMRTDAVETHPNTDSQFITVLSAGSRYSID